MTQARSAKFFIWIPSDSFLDNAQAVPFAVFVPAVMILFGVALVLVCFIPEAVKAKKLLESAFYK